SLLLRYMRCHLIRQCIRQPIVRWRALALSCQMYQVIREGILNCIVILLSLSLLLVKTYCLAQIILLVVHRMTEAGLRVCDALLSFLDHLLCLLDSLIPVSLTPMLEVDALGANLLARVPSGSGSHQQSDCCADQASHDESPNEAKTSTIVHDNFPPQASRSIFEIELCCLVYLKFLANCSKNSGN